MRRAATIAAVLAACLGAGCAGGSGRDATLVARSGLAMGSSVTLMAWTADQDLANTAFDAVFAEFLRLENLLSTWKPESDISRLNAAAGHHPVTIGADAMTLLNEARDISDLTGGKFDVTFAALGDLWKFEQDQDNVVPGRPAIEARLPLIDYRRLVLDRRQGTAFLQQAGMRVNVGGIGKGYAVDRAVAILRDAGLGDFSVQAGGDLYVAGRHNRRPWRLGIADPRAPDGEVFARMELSDSTFSTSGDYERAFVKDGVRYHHIIDPDTGEPGRLSRSVTIVATRAVLADGLSTGIFLLGPEQGLALVERLRDVEAVIVGADNRVHISSGLQGRLAVLREPTNGL